MHGQPIKPHLLLLSDDPEFRTSIQDFLTHRGYQTEALPSGESLQQYFRRQPVHLTILDKKASEQGQLVQLKQLKTLYPQLPVVMLSEKSESDSCVCALEMGANDYIRKPVALQELLARIRIILGYSYPDWAQKRFKSEQLLFDFDQEIFTRQGIMLELTPRESDLLYLFCQNQNQLLTREYLVEKVIQKKYHPLDRHIDVYINHLRKKIELDPKQPQYIRTVWGQGYVFSTADP